MPDANKQLLSGENRNRYLLPTGLFLFVLLLTFLPHLYFTFFPPEEKFYPSCTTAELDTSTYFMWAREARSGVFHWENRDTPESDAGGYFNLAWAVVGWTSGISGADISLVYRLLWLGANAFLILTTLRFARRFISEEPAWLFSAVVLFLGGGWGVLALGAGLGGRESFFPADLTIPETHFFHAMLAAPHFPLALALMLSAFTLFLSALEMRRIAPAALAGVCALLLSFVHLYDVITLWGVGVFFGATLALLRRLRREYIKYFLLLLLPTLPALLYFAWLTNTNVVLQAWKMQNECRSPSGWSYLVGFAPMLIMLLLCPGLYILRRLFRKDSYDSASPAISRWREKSLREIFLWCWLIGGALLLYSFPLFNFERRLVMGWSVPIVLLGTQTLFECLKNLSKKRRSIVIALALGLCLLGTPATLVVQFSPRMISNEAHAVLNFLQKGTESKRGEVVLATPEISEWIPAFSAFKVFATRTALTVDVGEKLRLSRRFLSGEMAPEETQAFLRKWQIRYLVISSPPLPSYVPQVKEVFHAGAFRVLRIQ